MYEPILFSNRNSTKTTPRVLHKIIRRTIIFYSDSRTTIFSTFFSTSRSPTAERKVFVSRSRVLFARLWIGRPICCTVLRLLSAVLLDFEIPLYCAGANGKQNLQHVTILLVFFFFITLEHGPWQCTRFQH